MSPGALTEKVTIFCADVDLETVGGIYGLAEEGEDILVERWSFEKAFSAMDRFEIRNAMTLIALQWLRLQTATGTL